MMFQRESTSVDLIELLDRILDKGVVINKSALLRLSTDTLERMRARLVLDSTNRNVMTMQRNNEHQRKQ